MPGNSPRRHGPTMGFRIDPSTRVLSPDQAPEALEVAYKGHQWQRRILFGGGFVISAVLAIVACLVMLSMARDYVAERYAEFVVRAVLMQIEFKAREHALLVEERHEEATWKTRAPAPSATVDAFVRQQGREVLQANPEFSPILALGDLHAPPQAGFARYLALAQDFSYRVGAYSTTQGQLLGAYFYSPDGGFVTITPAPQQPMARRPDGTTDTRALMRSVLNESDLASVMGAEGRRGIVWLSPIENRLTGRNVVRAIQVCYLDDKPFLFVVSEIPVNALQEKLPAKQPGERAWIVDDDGRRVVEAGAQDDGHGDAAVVAANRSWPALQEGRPDLRYQGWRIVFRSGLPASGWMLYQTMTWQTVLYGIGKPFAVVLAALAVAMATVWFVMLLLSRRILRPGLDRLKRILDSENLNRAMVSTAPTGLMLLDLEKGTVLLENDVARATSERISAGSPPLRERLHALFRQNEQMHPAQAEGELTVELNDDEQSDLFVSTVRAIYRGRDVILCNFIDITARKRLERNLAEASRAADSANRAKSTFLATMSHEIRTPLNAILGSLELLDRTSLTDAQRKRVVTALTSGTSLLDIINDILDVSKIEAGQMTIEHVPFDFVSVARDVAALFEPVAKSRHLAFGCMIDPELAPRYVGDPTRIRQVMINLVGNAIKFTESGEVVFEVYLEDADDRNRVVIGVIDSGIGMSPEQQQNLFRVFTQADSSITRRFGGSGLGLALCKQLVDLMHGKIECTSEPGVGSTFIVRLKLDVDHEQTDASEAPSFSDGDAAGRIDDLKLLVVDDHPVNRELLHEQLAALGYVSDIAEGGMAAIRMMTDTRYDMLITDLNMPEMNGYALASVARDRGASMPIIALTAHATEQERAMCRAVGVDEVLVKPVPLGTIDAAIRRLARGTRAASSADETGRDPARGPLTEAMRAQLLQTLDVSIEVIRDALACDDVERVASELHTIKGAFAVIHEPAVVQVCQRLEALAKQRDLPAVADEIGVLRPLADQALARRRT
ncbi:ATP-binding protein [Burkholderia ubonensis]|uniref:ATP-binding protein n=1 Tax=Burkholderia ubonensis TaxID=101571 RepID=UPI0018E02246|nr:ATP-binding protein [Burkholderia ubonensis]